MKFLSFLALLLLMSCDAQTYSQERKIPFEDIYHHSTTLISPKFQVLDSQQKMDEVYAKIHQKNGGNRQAPIPSVNDSETYLIFKPTLKNANDVQILDVSLKNKTLKIFVRPFDNPDFNKNSRFTPNVLLKLHKKVNIQKVIITTQK